MAKEKQNKMKVLFFANKIEKVGALHPSKTVVEILRNSLPYSNNINCLLKEGKPNPVYYHTTVRGSVRFPNPLFLVLALVNFIPVNMGKFNLNIPSLYYCY